MDSIKVYEAFDRGSTPLTPTTSMTIEDVLRDRR